MVFSSDRGPWVAPAAGDLPQDILDGYPEGTVTIPAMPSDGKLYEAGTANGDFAWVEVDPPGPTIDDVAIERDRRLATGFYYDFGDARGVHQLGTTEADMRRWMDEVTPLAQARINIGEPNSTIGILTNTGPVQVTAMEWQHILIAAGDYRQPLYAASFALQAMNPIPADYATNPDYWP